MQIKQIACGFGHDTGSTFIQVAPFVAFPNVKLIIPTKIQVQTGLLTMFDQLNRKLARER